MGDVVRKPDAHSEWLSVQVPGFAEALAWPDAEAAAQLPC